VEFWKERDVSIYRVEYLDPKLAVVSNVRISLNNTVVVISQLLPKYLNIWVAC